MAGQLMARQPPMQISANNNQKKSEPLSFLAKDSGSLAILYTALRQSIAIDAVYFVIIARLFTGVSPQC
jgi:hypothetical protein